MSRDVSGGLQGTTIFQIDRDSSGPEAVITNMPQQSSHFCTALHDAKGIHTGQSFFCELFSATAYRLIVGGEKGEPSSCRALPNISM